MKKIALIFMALCLVVCCVFLVGCDEDNENGDGGNQPTHPPQLGENDDTSNSENNSGKNDGDSEGSENTLTEEEERLADEYEAYKNMSGDAQGEFMDSFDSKAEFSEWLDKAQKAHKKREDLNTPTIDGSGNVDLGEYF